MHRGHYLTLTALGAFLASAGGIAHAAFSGASDSRITFAASGPAGMSIEGSTAEMTLADQGDNVTITVPLGNLTTGIALRDRHMREKYLEVPKYPTATLTVARGALRVPTSSDKVEADVPSTLTLHGQSRAVVVHYDLKKDGAALVTHGKFHINMQDFGITVPTYLGITVKPDVDVSASFHVGGG